MELQVVVETLARELDEVADVNRCVLACQLNANVTLRSVQNRNLVARGLVFRSIERHKSSSFLFGAPGISASARLQMTTYEFAF